APPTKIPPGPPAPPGSPALPPPLGPAGGLDAHAGSAPAGEAPDLLDHAAGGRSVEAARKAQTLESIEPPSGLSDHHDARAAGPRKHPEQAAEWPVTEHHHGLPRLDPRPLGRQQPARPGLAQP